MRKRSKNWVSIADALASVSKRLGIAKKMHRYEVWNQWEKIAGPLVSAHAMPSRWQGSTLIIKVEHASWMQELSFLKQELLQKTREEIPDIDISDIRFEIGKIKL